MNRQEQIQSIFPDESEIPSDLFSDLPVQIDHYLVDGKLVPWQGPMAEAVSPVRVWNREALTPRLIGRYPLLSAKQALTALGAAILAYDNGRGLWPTFSVGQRIRHVQDFVAGMMQQRSKIVRLLMWEIGKSRSDSIKEFDRTVEYIQDTVDALKDLDRVSSRFVMVQNIIGQIRRAPLGVVLCMGPFNYPLNESLTTLIPALIMGNTAIFKPPKHGVMLYGPLLETFRDAFPPGVVNILFGAGRSIVPPLMASARINVLALIGSSGTANEIRKQHPKPNRMRCVLGMEAKNAGIVLPDADPDLTAAEVLQGCLSFNGQRCTALKMIFVHKSRVDVFLDRLCRAIDALTIGMPWKEKVMITPLPEPGKPAYLAGLVEDACEMGAQIVNACGGRIHESFYYPAVLYPVTDRMRVYREEQFGPVIPVLGFSDIQTPIDYLTASDYGQQLSIFGNDPNTIARLIDPLVNQVCRVNLNSQCQRGPDSFPFTGRKDSAEGTLSVSDALRAFSIRTLVAARNTEANRAIINNIVREHKSNFLSTDFIL